MPRKRRVIPWLTERKGVWYWNTYDAKLQRTVRLSCKTTDRSAAEEWCKQNALSVGGTGARNPWRSVARKMCRRAKENAKAKSRLFALSADEVLALLHAQSFRCAVTNVALRPPKARRDPWAPSLDQIAPGGGYTSGNVRIVTVLVNTAMNQWGQEPFLEHLREMIVTRQWFDKNSICSPKSQSSIEANSLKTKGAP